MSFIHEFSIQAERKAPFPFDVPAILHAQNLNFENPLTFIIGDNGTGKSTLLETLAMKLNLPLIGGYINTKRGFEAASILQKHIHLEQVKRTTNGFFFRAEDFSHFVDSVERNNRRQESSYSDMRGDVPDHIIEQMKASNNFALHSMREEYGQDMIAFSHGEAYMKIMHDRIKSKGIFLLDEPEAALSPAKQLSLIFFIKEHLNLYDSQFIVATHSPMLMAIPGATIYEVTEEGMEEVPLESTDHYMITRSFLNDPMTYLRHL